MGIKTNGYRELDLNGFDLSTVEAKTVPGAYAHVEGATRAVLVTGLSIAGTEYKPAYAFISVDSGKIYLYVGNDYAGGTPKGIYIEIANNDAVKIVKV